jgi:hypothetical protein
VSADDYNPSILYTWKLYSHQAGIQDQSSVVNEADLVYAWNTWASTSNLQLGSPDCGHYWSCIIYIAESVNCGGDPTCYNGGNGSPSKLTWTNCPMPELTDHPLDHFATTYYIAGGQTNLPDTADCSGLAPYANVPIYVVVVQQYSYTDDYRTHIGRHEMGHALGLDHFSGTCWRDGAGLWEPLMQPGHCLFYGGTGWPDFSGFPVQASPNEIATVKWWQGW